MVLVLYDVVVDEDVEVVDEGIVVVGLLCGFEC